jgi:hypothetical protein
MNSIIDLPQQQFAERKYLRRSAILYIIYGFLFLLLILLLAFKPDSLTEEDVEKMSFWIGLDCFLMPLISPLGIYFVIRSFKRKEGTALIRIIHLMGHIVLSVLLIVLVTIIIMKMSSLR